MNKCLERANDRHFLESWILQYEDVAPTQEYFFFIVISIVYAAIAGSWPLNMGIDRISWSPQLRGHFELFFFSVSAG